MFGLPLLNPITSHLPSVVWLQLPHSTAINDITHPFVTMHYNEITKWFSQSTSAMWCKIYGIIGLRPITAHPQKWCDTKPLTTFPHATNHHFTHHWHHLFENQKPPPTLSFLNKTNKCYFSHIVLNIYATMQRTWRSTFRGFQLPNSSKNLQPM